MAGVQVGGWWRWLLMLAPSVFVKLLGSHAIGCPFVALRGAARENDANGRLQGTNHRRGGGGGGWVGGWVGGWMRGFCS